MGVALCLACLFEGRGGGGADVHRLERLLNSENLR